MGNILKKLQEKRIDNLYKKKKEATMSGNMAKKERIDAKIAKARGRTLSDEDYTMKNGGSTSKKTPKAAMVMLMKNGGKKPKMKAGGSLKPVNSSENPGLAKLPTPVRNKMGYQKKGGSTKRK